MYTALYAAVLLQVASALETPPVFQPLERLESYEPVWTTPSKDAAGSMPIGNGTCGANVWLDEAGDLVLLLSRTDSWSEAARLLKIGRVRLRTTPPLWSAGMPVQQRLNLSEGRIDLSIGANSEGRVSIWFDKDAPVLRVELASAAPAELEVQPDNWRTERRRLHGQELQSSWTMRDAPASVVVEEDGDTSYSTPTEFGWWHANRDSVVAFTLQHQGLQDAAALVRDPLKGRIFGASIRRTPDSANTAHAVTVALPCTQGVAVDGWRAEAARLHAHAPSASASRAATATHWQEFWSRSWLEVDGRAPLVAPGMRHPLRVGHDSNGQNLLSGLVARVSLHKGALDDGSMRTLVGGGRNEVSGADLGRLATWVAGPDASHTSGTEWHSGYSWLAGPPKLIGVQPFQRQTVDGIHGVRVDRARGVWAEGVNFDPSRSFTVEAWLRLDENAGPGRILDQLTAGGSDGFLFDTHPGRSLRLVVGSRTIVADDVLQAGRWTHVAARHDVRTAELALFVDGKCVRAERDTAETDGERITRAWILQRWVSACAAGGPYPIKFNGSIFTVEPGLSGGPDMNPDWRKWGGDYWWQNTRLSYYPMLARGEYAQMRPLFDFYASMLPLCEARAKAYYGAQGVYFPETVNVFGCYSNGDYGWDRAGLDRSVVQCPYWMYAWQQGLELVSLMLDWYAHTQDESFLQSQLVPMARSVLLYMDSRFWKDGRLVITPTQAAETYWYGVVDDLPTVAGLRAVCTQLLALGERAGDAVDRATWARLLAGTAALPEREVDGVKLFAAARVYEDRRNNCETPELYAVHPFQLLGVGLPGLEQARETWRRRIDKAAWGWTQDGICAARLGLADAALQDLATRAKNAHPAHRLPVVWGPNFDWLPDQTHGGNLTSVAQEMLLQERGDTILLLPAWPKDWSARFKLRAARNTTVEGEVVRGALRSLRVEPPTRAKDVKLAGS